MLGYLIRRLIYVLPVALGVSLICFLLVHIAPGRSAGGRHADRRHRRAGGRDAGRLRFRQAASGPVRHLAGERARRAIWADRSPRAGRWRPRCSAPWPTRCFWRSAASVIGFPLGLAMGFVAGYLRDTIWDRAVTALAITGVSTPELLARNGPGHHLFRLARLAALDGRRTRRVEQLGLELGTHASPDPARGDPGGRADGDRDADDAGPGRPTSSTRTSSRRSKPKGMTRGGILRHVARNAAPTALSR